MASCVESSMSWNNVVSLWPPVGIQRLSQGNATQRREVPPVAGIGIDAPVLALGPRSAGNLIGISWNTWSQVGAGLTTMKFFFMRSKATAYWPVVSDLPHCAQPRPFDGTSYLHLSCRSPVTRSTV